MAGRRLVSPQLLGLEQCARKAKAVLETILPECLESDIVRASSLRDSQVYP